MKVSIEKIEESDKEEFKKKIQESFGIAVKEELGSNQKPPVIPSDEEIENAFKNPDFETYCIYYNGIKVGGVVVKADFETKINTLELFFIYKEKLNSGLGLSAWKEIEKLYPDTKVWKTVTPYFEKRNINFYVNKCGFHIVEFCNKFHQNPNIETPNDNIQGEEDFFVFEKVM